MTFIEAAAEVLRLAGKPMHYKEITEVAIEKNLLSHVGKTPEVTMGARLAALLKKEDKGNPIVRVKPGVFALREWDEKKGRGRKRDEEVVEAPAEDQALEVNALEVEAATRVSDAETPVDAPRSETDIVIVPDEYLTPAAPVAAPPVHAAHAAAAAIVEEDDEPVILTGEEALRADLAASGAELFDDEEDDDQPILAPEGSADAAAGEGGRRRRRRRRRGRGGAPGDVPADRASTTRLDGSFPAAPATPSASNLEGDAAPELARDPLAPAPRPMVRDRHQIMAGGSPTGIEVPPGEAEELSGRELADAAAVVLAGFDRNAGPVPLRSVVEGLMRRGRLTGDPAQASIQLSASLRADNLRRSASSQRARFRFSNGSRVALTEWLLGGDLVRLEQEVLASVERFREAARRVILRRVQELPGHALVELALLGLERAGMTSLRPVRRAGAPGGEVHFSAIHKSGGDEIRTAIVIRKDGREIGRERVTDLRGALHHYGSATSGWLVTTGQVLSGAREEANAVGAPPVALYDGLALCKLLEDSDVAVQKTRFAIALPDLEILEMLRGG